MNDSTRGTEPNGPPPADDAPTPSSAEAPGTGARTWKKSPSIWPEPIQGPKRPDLWSPEARRTGPIPTATLPLAAEATMPDKDATPGASDDDGENGATPADDAAPTDNAAAVDPPVDVEDAEAAGPEAGGPEAVEEAVEGEDLSYTGIFKKISDEDLAAAAAAATAAGSAEEAVADAQTGDATAPFDVSAEFVADDAGEAATDDLEPDAEQAPAAPPAPEPPPALVAAADEVTADDRPVPSSILAADPVVAAEPVAAAEPEVVAAAAAAGATSVAAARAARIESVLPSGHDGGVGDGAGSSDGADNGTGDGSGATAGAGGASGGREPGKRRKKALIIAGSVVGVLAIGYGVAYAVAGDSLARGATVAGIEVGGMTRDEARSTLTEQLPGVVDAPISVTVDGDDATYEVVPSSIGLAVDVDATLNRVPGASANPLSLAQALIGSGETTPVASVDDATLEAAIADIASQSDTEPVNGSVAFDAGKVVTSEPVAGRKLDAEAAAAALTAAFYGEDSDSASPVASVTFPAAVAEPVVGADDVQKAVAEFAEPAMSGPVTVAADGNSVDLPPAVFGQAITMSPDDGGVLQPVMDPKMLAEAASDELEDLGQEGKDASIVIEGGRPVVVEAEPGLAIAPEALRDALMPVLISSGDDRQIEVELTEADPEVTTDAAEKLGIKEVVAEFTTNFPPANYRDVNIGTAARRIDNTLLLPGEEFSLNGIVGERTEANGFTTGTIIDGGRLKEDLGGGVSQVATTSFHAAFLAGLEDVEHWPHTIYFDRYPIGQEATVAWGSKDMRFKNDTPYGVLVDTSFQESAGRGQGTLTVRIWSTKHYEVATSVGDRYSHTSPRTIYDTSDNCSAQGGSGGFSIDSFRTVKLLDGTVNKDEKKSWTYNPNHKVICGPEPGEREAGSGD